MKSIKVLAYNIEWDCDDDNSLLSLPTKSVVTLNLSQIEDSSDINRQICDQLSDHSGWCVLDYELQGYDSEADYALQMTLYQEEEE